MSLAADRLDGNTATNDDTAGDDGDRNPYAGAGRSGDDGIGAAALAPLRDAASLDALAGALDALAARVRADPGVGRAIARADFLRAVKDAKAGPVGSAAGAHAWAARVAPAFGAASALIRGAHGEAGTDQVEIEMVETSTSDETGVVALA